MVLAVEQHCASRADTLVGTVGKLAIAGGGAINVIPGEVEFTVDLRSGDDAKRRAAVDAVEAGCREIAARRRVQLRWEPFFELAAAPCDARLQAQWAAAIRALGVTPRYLPSGAGHDAMEFAPIAPIGMLFVRCGHGGISHHPDESLSAEDADLATRVFLHFLEHFDPASVAD
jgi:allantoate deiminase/N-carbamoyl-L-amino-acid hydrolase